MRKRWRPPQLLGPLFGYDLIASTRRGQHSGLRVFIASLLLVTLYVVYALRVQGFDPFANPFKPGPRLDPRVMNNFAATFTAWCMIVQFGAIILLTPIVVADAIAREKERRALDFLFVTALTDSEIILGKLSSRLAYLIGVLLTGLPILALTPLFGGIDPNVLFAEYAALIATLISLGALSLYCSVVSKTAVQATMRAYAAAVIYLVICPCLVGPWINSEAAVPGLFAYVTANLVLAVIIVTVSVHDLRPKSELLPPAPVIEPPRRPQVNKTKFSTAVARVVQGEIESDDDLPFVLPAGDSAVADAPSSPPTIHGWDPVEWRNLDRPAVWEPPEIARPPLPPVDERRPLLWKEVYLHSIVGSAPGGPTAVGALLISAAVLAGLIWFFVAVSPKSRPDVVAFSTGAVKVGTVILGGLLCLAGMAHSVNSISREYEKDTLDALLTLPVNRGTVLAAKWLGGLVSVRVVFVALAGVWVFGLATGGLHPLALIALILTVAAVVEFLTGLGLWLSMVCKTSLRANMAAILSLLFVAVGPLVVAQYVELLSPYSGANHAAADDIMETLMPAVSWLYLCIGWAEYAKVPEGRIPAILLGALGYAIIAWLLWRMTLSRFNRYGGKRS